MIPREILKKIRQIELRTNRPVTGFTPGARASARFSVRPPAVSKTNLALNSLRPPMRRERRAPIPTGLRPPAQGREKRATLGRRPPGLTNRNAVAAISFSSAARGIGPNPVGVGDDLIPSSQGSSCIATLGYMPESRWDSPNSIASETFAGVSFQPPAQLHRISRTMPEGADNHLGTLVFNDEKYRIWPRGGHFCFLSQPAGKGKAGGILANGFEKSLQIFGESLTDSRLASVIEFNGFGKFPFRLRLNDNAKTHRPARNSFSRSATTSSRGRQRSGCASARSARRSSSAICSGVSMSSNLSRSCSKTSRCSSNGSRSSCSKTWIWAELMSPIYPVTGAMQMKTQPRPAAISP